MSANWDKLSRAWIRDFLPPSSAGPISDSPTLENAMRRTLPLLSEDPTSVPFLCRYRSDVIDPLSTEQVHQLSEYVRKYGSLSSLRAKVLDQLKDNGCTDPSTIARAETTISKSQLEDMYIKPPSKGTLEDRIQKDHPHLSGVVDELWSKRLSDADMDRELIRRARPMEKAVILLANRIAADVAVMDALMDYCGRRCGVTVKQAAVDSKAKAKAGIGKKSPSSSFETYHNYTNKLSNLRDHQVLAIRRGVDQKSLKLGFDIDDTPIDRIIQQAAFAKRHNHKLYEDARKDAWSRLLRRRCTSRLWKDASKRAEGRSITVFCENLRKALLAPPVEMDGALLLALDPGFQAGIKCAILTGGGEVVGSLDTVKFLGGAKEDGKKKLISLLKSVRDKSGRDGKGVLVVLGNGHGTREARSLLQEAATEAGIAVDVRLVTEAGASVWSVTESASLEFPNEAPAAIACVSIGRRYLNPLNELVKIPPRSLGLGMYQHDLTEMILDEKLNLTSVDAVAEVGVDVNTCSAAILEKVPSLTAKLCSKIIQARPLKSRNDLLKVSGLGQKTFQNCAGFVRVTGGSEPLDGTLVHPESYELARWLLRKLQWTLLDKASAESAIGPQHEKWKDVAQKASRKFNAAEERVLTVINHLYFSITSPDPRLRTDNKESDTTTSNIGSISGCASLPSNASTIELLRECALPLRNIIATIRNVVDFGAFVDIGVENDALLHISKMGDVSLESLLVGQEIGVDILGITGSDKVKISVGIAGLNFPADKESKRKRNDDAKKPERKKQRRER